MVLPHLNEPPTSGGGRRTSQAHAGDSPSDIAGSGATARPAAVPGTGRPRVVRYSEQRGRNTHSGTYAQFRGTIVNSGGAPLPNATQRFGSAASRRDGFSARERIPLVWGRGGQALRSVSELAIHTVSGTKPILLRKPLIRRASPPGNTLSAPTVFVPSRPRQALFNRALANDREYSSHPFRQDMRAFGFTPDHVGAWRRRFGLPALSALSDSVAVRGGLGG